MQNADARNLTSNGAPSGDLPVHQPKGVHVRTLEGLKDVHVDHVIEYLRSHIPLKDTQVNLLEAVCTAAPGCAAQARARYPPVPPGDENS